MVGAARRSFPTLSLILDLSLVRDLENDRVWQCLAVLVNRGRGEAPHGVGRGSGFAPCYLNAFCKTLERIGSKEGQGSEPPGQEEIE